MVVVAVAVVSLVDERASRSPSRDVSTWRISAAAAAPLPLPLPPLPATALLGAGQQHYRRRRRHRRVVVEGLGRRREGRKVGVGYPSRCACVAVDHHLAAAVAVMLVVAAAAVASRGTAGGSVVAMMAGLPGGLESESAACPQSVNAKQWQSRRQSSRGLHAVGVCWSGLDWLVPLVAAGLILARACQRGTAAVVPAISWCLLSLVGISLPASSLACASSKSQRAEQPRSRREEAISSKAPHFQPSSPGKQDVPLHPRRRSAYCY